MAETQWRTVRVFISSTFRDMHAEREELVKRVFPQLRKLCEARGVTFTEVDLRWGVTDEQKAEGKVLPTCLAEIQRCRPYFIGLLGERYGWVPDEIPHELIEQEPWLAEHVEHSVTELEIIHGVLNNPVMANRACFYFRDPAYVERIPADRRHDFVETDATNRRKLTRLKERIRASGLALRENYPDPKTLGEWVLADLTAAINQAFPPGTEPEPLDREAAEHEAFARSRAAVYVGRPEYFDTLDDHAAGEGPPLVVLGESGSGKSALLANWALKYRESHPDDLLIMHFIGASAYSADWSAMLRRIMAEFKRTFGIEGEIPDKPDELRLAFANFLHMASARGRSVLILDGLNQLEDRDAAPDLVWLPPVIPPNVRLVLSTLPGRPLDDLKKRSWPTLTVEPLRDDERVQLITEYLAQYTKRLSPERTRRIASAPQTANPLYLRALLEELRVFGVHERLDERIENYLTAATVPELYERILERYEVDYERDRPGLVKDAMTHLWAARRGLSEVELLALLGTGGEPLPGAQWSPLFLAAEPSLVARSGLIGFFHDYLREAVRHRYLPTDEAEHDAHLRLADYFDVQELGPRKVDELPWQLAEANAWERLKDRICDLDVFLRLRTDEKKYELVGYWLQLGNRYDMVVEYPNALREYETRGGAGQDLTHRLNGVARFLHESARHTSAEPLIRRALEIDEASLGPDHPRVATHLNNLATLLQDTNRLAEAEPLMRRSLEIDEVSFGPEHPRVAVGLNNLAHLLHAANRLAEAEPLYRRALEIEEASFGLEHPGVAAALSNLAHLLSDANRLVEAEQLTRRALRILKASVGPAHPEVAVRLSDLALLLQDANRLAEAEPLMRRALEIDEAAFGPDHPRVATGLSNLAQLLQGTNRLAEAEPLYRRALEIDEASFGPNHPDVATDLNNLAGLLQATNRLAEAEPLMRRALEIDEASFGPEHPSVAIGLNNLAQLLQAASRLAEAEPLKRRALAIFEMSFGPEHPKVALALNNLAQLLHANNRLGEAETLIRRALQIDEASFGPDHPTVAIGLNNLARVLQDRNRPSEAEPLMRRAADIMTSSLGQDHPWTQTVRSNLEALRRQMGG